ncbi:MULTISPECIES: hypothetical protein [unclassified Anaerotruncus]|uniref:hypothetical protein n=1 Tax=unclassified Anaerotruncus TaxID=2641626 RepID=UPI000336E74E|nr:MULTISPECIES: hypothetical protein [unclassified Anaerotruncus]EOS56349.1 hypothetical protein C814_02831 [Anaerotruncus sp. G3(2012)]MCI9236653.1 hypothetical protein [Anaerotruncus sp.]NBK17476.1 hypothetical protein [Anaerotruncus sp. 1XD42-93]RKJ97560.1 hypothetical protein D7Y41_08150 [Anaerotruncus sp. 1XD22-93]
MKRERKWITTVELVIVLLATVAVFVWGKRATMTERGYAACGGEYSLLLLPVLYYIWKQVLIDWITELRYLWRDKKV